MGRVDAATRALRAHEVEGAGAFGVDRRATRSAAAELARAGDALRACGKDTRARVAAAAARRGAEACRAWSEEPGCAKSLARLGGDEKSRAKKRKRGKAEDSSADAAKESGSDENDFFEDDRALEETLELNPAERRALAEDVHARVGAGGARAADAVRLAVARAGRRAAEEAAERARDALLAASAQCCARDRPLASAPPDALQRASEAIEFLLFKPVGETAARGGAATFAPSSRETEHEKESALSPFSRAALTLARAIVPTLFAPLLDDGASSFASRATARVTDAWGDGDALVRAASEASAEDLGGVSVGAGVCTRAVIAHVAARVSNAVADAAVDALVVETARGVAVAPGPSALCAKARAKLERDVAAHCAECAAATRHLLWEASENVRALHRRGALHRLPPNYAENVRTTATARFLHAVERDAPYVARLAADGVADWVRERFAGASARVAEATGVRAKQRVAPALAAATFTEGFRPAELKGARACLKRVAGDFQAVDAAARALRRVVRALDPDPTTPEQGNEPEPFLPLSPPARGRRGGTRARRRRRRRRPRRRRRRFRRARAPSAVAARVATTTRARRRAPTRCFARQRGSWSSPCGATLDSRRSIGRDAPCPRNVAATTTTGASGARVGPRCREKRPRATTETVCANCATATKAAGATTRRPQRTPTASAGSARPWTP